EDTKIRRIEAAVRARRPRFARQAVQESQIQAALDHELFVFAVLGRPGCRPQGRRRRTRVSAGWRTRRSRISLPLRDSFDSSILRIFDIDRGYVSARQRAASRAWRRLLLLIDANVVH